MARAGRMPGRRLAVMVFLCGQFGCPAGEVGAQSAAGEHGHGDQRVGAVVG